MSGSINKVILVGNVGRDPETRSFNSGDSVVTFSLATTESWRDKATGERKERTEWHNIVIFNENLGKIAEQYVKKGSKIYLEGQLQNREYTDKEGQQRRTTEIVLQRFRGELTLLDRRAGEGERSMPSSYMGEESHSNPGSSPRMRDSSAAPGERAPLNIASIIDDEIPF